MLPTLFASEPHASARRCSYSRLRVTAPDGSATVTSYSGNTNTVTDPVGKRKKFTYDASGNLTQVAEPDAAT